MKTEYNSLCRDRLDTIYSRRERAYLSLSHPNFEQRYQQRRLNDEFFQAAIREQNGHALKNLLEGRIHFEMDVDSRHICFESWSRERAFSQQAYSFNGDAIFCRDTNFFAGDILLVNRNNDADGIFTTLVDSAQNFAHVALVAVLEKDGQKFPAVIEIHHEGVRAVPLNIYLNDIRTAYLEVYRFQSIDVTGRNAINKVCRSIIQEPHGFSVNMDDSQDFYLSCTMVAALIYRRAGVGVISGSSRYSLKTLRNLEILGIESCAYRDLLMPDDFSTHPDFEIVGVLDNGRFLSVNARTMVREHIREIWQTQVLDPRGFPKSFPMIKFAIDRIHKKTFLLGPAFAKIFGFNCDNFPSGPSTFISLATAAENLMIEAVKEISIELEAGNIVFHKGVAWEEIVRDPKVREKLDQALKGFKSWFRPS